MIDSPLLNRFDAYINGQWVAADDGRQLAVSNPATGDTLAQVPFMGATETRRAITAAKAALAQVPDITTRRRWLEHIRDRLTEQREEIGRILCLEHGKPWPEAQAEVDYAASFFDYYAKNMEAFLAPRHLPEKVKNCDWTVYSRPVGVVGLITPWNFPIAMIAKKLAPALAAGCPSITKPAELTPLTMMALFRIMDDIDDLPAGMVNLVMGDAAAIGGALMDSLAVPMVSFTGSTRVGRLLMQQAAPRIKRLDLELGGNAPFIVLDDADLDATADGLLANKFRGAGQTCVCANRVFVADAVYDAFADKVRERMAALRVGNGMDDGVHIGPLINRAGYDKVAAHLNDAVNQGAQVLTGLHPDNALANDSLFFTPTLLRDVTQSMLCFKEETFGPLVPLVRFHSDEELLTAANDTDYGLAAYVFGGDKKRLQHIVSRLHFGHCAINTGTGPAAPTPFGGMLGSGIGHEGGAEGIAAYVELQTVPDGS